MYLIRTGIIIVFLLLPLTGYALPAKDVESINDRAYFPRIHALFQEAKKSISVIMFSAHYYDRYPNSPSNILFRDLAEAQQRGVQVRVVLEQDIPKGSGWFGAQKLEPVHHRRVVDFLKAHGIPYTLEDPDITTHAKLVIVDNIYTVIGSFNWSYSALTKNYETAVVITSPDVARVYELYFDILFSEK